MLSILVPIYNENVVELVSILQHQCEELELEYEIICIDDCSIDRIHTRNVIGLSNKNIKYQRLHENIGRARIKNKLIDFAVYKQLLFIDADHMVISKDFIKTYSVYFNVLSFTLLYGGTIYPDKSIIGSKYFLHWRYGSSREAIPADKRSLNAANHLHSNNLLVNKSLLGDIRFDESIIGYGYEDILFAQEISHNGKTIKHIDNPLMHLGLKSTESFIIDLKAASKNLAILYTGSKISNLKIIYLFEFLKKFLLLAPVIFLLRTCEPLLINLLRKAPYLLNLVDALRLLYFAQTVQIHHKS